MDCKRLNLVEDIILDYTEEEFKFHTKRIHIFQYTSKSSIESIWKTYLKFNVPDNGFKHYDPLLYLNTKLILRISKRWSGDQSPQYPEELFEMKGKWDLDLTFDSMSSSTIINLIYYFSNDEDLLKFRLLI